MNRRNDRSVPACASMLVAAASLAFSPAAFSLGLGDARVESYLNQPLQARIDLISQASDDLGSVTVRLASVRDYELIGANREAISVPIRFTVEDMDGDAYIQASSDLPIGDPVLRLIVEVTWSSGRMLREYTLFLDPPTTAEAAPAPAPRIDQRKAPPAPPPVAETAPSPAPAARETAPEQPAPAAVPAAGEYGPVRSGETLWGIASNWARGTGLSVNQVMIAIQRENPDAFLNNNINLLKRGAILRLPDAAEVQQISQAAATQEVLTQGDAFAARAPATVASPAMPLLAEESAAPEPLAPPPAAEEPDLSLAGEPDSQATEPEAREAQASDEAVAAADDAEEAVDAAVDQDLLELVPPSAESGLNSTAGFEEAIGDAAEGENVQDLRESLARTEEELINQQQQNEYLEERIRELESQLDTAEQPGVDDADAANMQERLREQREAAAQAAAQAADGQSPWYARFSTWLIGILALVVIAVVGWLFRRRGQEFAFEDAAEESLRDIKSEAEDVLRVLSDTGAAAEVEDEAEDAAEEAAEDETPAEDNVTPISAAKPRHKDEATGVSAEMLDEDSSDPEIQLDLARAYISMGDKEAARVILQEVLANGTEEQQAEAQKMLDLLA